MRAVIPDSIGPDPLDLKIIDDFVDQLRRLGRPKTTRGQYRGVLRGLAAFLARRDKGLLNAVYNDLISWRDQLRITDASIGVYIAIIRSFYTWATHPEQQLILANPAASLPAPRISKRLPRPISSENLALALERAVPRIRIWLVLAAYAGLRCCDIAPLRRDQILETARPHPYLRIEESKGGKWRLVPMHPDVWIELVRFGLPGNGYIFRRGDGRPGPISARRVSALANEHLHDLGIADTMHALRHYFGTMAQLAIHDLQTVAEIMGHASLNTTRGYAAYDLTQGARAVLGIPRIQRLRIVDDGAA
jgi:integrase